MRRLRGFGFAELPSVGCLRRAPFGRLASPLARICLRRARKWSLPLPLARICNPCLCSVVIRALLGCDPAFFFRHRLQIGASVRLNLLSLTVFILLQ